MRSTARIAAWCLRSVDRGRSRLAAAIALASAASAASVALMGVSAWLISRAAEHPPVMYLVPASVGVRFFGISRGVFRYLERVVGHELALRMQSALRVETYTRLARTTLLGRRRGDLLSRVIADVAAIQDLLVRVLVPAASASLVIVGTTTILSVFSPAYALVLLASSVLAGLVLPLATQRMSLAQDARSVSVRGELADRTHEVSRAAADLAAYGVGEAQVARTLEVDARLRAIEYRAAWARGVATAGQVLAAGTAVLAALWIGGAAVASGDLKPRLLAVLALTPLALHEVFADFTKAAQTHTRAKAALTRLAEALDAEPIGRGDVEPVAGEPELALTGLSAGWPGGAGPVVRGLSLTMGRGDRVGLVGPSGIGKTTIAATIMGLIPPVAGEARVSGRVGYLAQDAHIFATTVAENVRIGDKDATDEQVAEALASAGLDLAPEREIGEQGSTISGGEARRLALARVLAHKPDLLILDEPTEHLDADTAEALMADLWRAAGDRPVLVITHDPQVMADCDQIVRLG